MMPPLRSFDDVDGKEGGRKKPDDLRAMTTLGSRTLQYINKCIVVQDLKVSKLKLILKSVPVTMWIIQKLYESGTGNQCTLSNINLTLSLGQLRCIIRIRSLDFGSNLYRLATSMPHYATIFNAIWTAR